MKYQIFNQFFVSVCIGSLLIIGAGCSKKTVIPPGSETGANQTGLTNGTDINYPDAEGNYATDDLPAEGTLDDSTVASEDSGSGLTGEAQSFEDMKIHGRSSGDLQSIYFQFDQAGVQTSMTDILILNADYINSIPGKVVILEGNSDERGTAEYNLALGERRAITTQQYLENLGVDPRRLRTLSYGEEKPLFLGQDEEAYSLNRRVDFIIQ